MSSFFLPSLFIPLLFTSPVIFLFAYLGRKLNIDIPRLTSFWYRWGAGNLIALSILSACLSAFLAPTTLSKKLLILLYQSVILVAPFFGGGWASTIYVFCIFPFFYLGFTVSVIWSFAQSNDSTEIFYLLFLTVTYAYAFLFLPAYVGSAKIVGINNLSKSLVGIEIVGASDNLARYTSIGSSVITLIAHFYYFVIFLWQ